MNQNQINQKHALFYDKVDVSIIQLTILYSLCCVYNEECLLIKPVLLYMNWFVKYIYKVLKMGVVMLYYVPMDTSRNIKASPHRVQDATVCVSASQTVSKQKRQDFSQRNCYLEKTHTLCSNLV
jgi:hypothetical protein